jgi:plasmid stability protein
VKRLAKLVLARNYGKVAARHGVSSEKEVIQSLLQLVAAETAADVEKLSSDTLFPEDLHIY